MKVFTWSRLAAMPGKYRAALRFCLRMSLSALLAFGLAQLGTFPLRGLWAVLTAIVVTQVSVGGSILAITEYIVGTLAGVVYASIVALLLPHHDTLHLAGVLVLSIAPPAIAAALNPMFRVAPFTAAIVLFISTEYAQSPVESAIYRTLEVLLGGISVILVSLLVLPDTAHQRGLKTASTILDRLAHVLPALLEGFSEGLTLPGAIKLQEGLGDLLVRFQATAAEARHERFAHLHSAVDISFLSPILLRLRHDLVIIGRTLIAPFPGVVGVHLNAAVAEVSLIASTYLKDCGEALSAGRAPPDPLKLEAAFKTYASGFAAIRHDGLTRTLSDHETERVFALSFAFEQLHQDLLDLQNGVLECAGLSPVPGRAAS